MFLSINREKNSYADPETSSSVHAYSPGVAVARRCYSGSVAAAAAAAAAADAATIKKFTD